MHGNFTIESADTGDAAGIYQLYLAVAAVEGGLARTKDEITTDYIGKFLAESLRSGVCVVARSDDGRIVGEIHAYALGPKVFAHVLGELTIAVHPEFQGCGVGRAIFTRLMEIIETDRPDILRVELIARESNAKAITFYETLGFRTEGRFQGRIKSVGGGFEDDIPMAWLRG